MHKTSLYYSWSKEFLEAGKKRLAGDTGRNATTGEVRHLRDEARALKEVVAEQTLELRLLTAHDLITSPTFIVIKAAESFHTKTTAPNQLWQTDFTYLKVIGWDGSTCRPSLTISRAISSPGSFARPWPRPR